MGCFFEGADDVSSGDFECERSFVDLPDVFRHMRDDIPDMYTGAQLSQTIPSPDPQALHGGTREVSVTL